MSCISNRPSWPASDLRTLSAQQCARALAPLAFAALCSCSGDAGQVAGSEGNGPADPSQSGAMGQDGNLPGVGENGAASDPSQPGAVGASDPGQPGAVGASDPGQPGDTSTPGQPGDTSTPSQETGGDVPVVLSEGGVKLRLLTQTEFVASVQSLLGTLTTELATPPDTSVAGFVAVGASQMTVTDSAATAYETASQAATAEVFSDTQRWQELVGCAPQADLSDACVTTYIEDFGRRAFRRDLTDEELQQWVGVAQTAATLAGDPAEGLARATSGLLQSPNFLYRVEKNALDAASGRLKYDGMSMAHRLSYGLIGAPPSPALLDAAASGQLDTAEGVRTAAAPLLADDAVNDRMMAFFSEYTQLAQVTQIAKSETMFPSFTAELKSSMLQGAELFIKNIVLGAGADVRAFYDSEQTYADANLAALYEVTAPASGFEKVTPPANTGRAGILGQAAVIAGQSQSDRTSPTRRGIFVLQSLLCTNAPPPPGGVDVTIIPPDESHTTRQNLEAHRVDPLCAGCHAVFDPFGLALEHFDPIGQYRETEMGLPIDATGEVNGVAFDGAAELGSVLREDPRTVPCLLRNFYRNENGRAEDDRDLDQIDSMAASLEAQDYVWNSFLADFVASDAFRSAPALPIPTETK